MKLHYLQHCFSERFYFILASKHYTDECYIIWQGLNIKLGVRISWYFEVFSHKGIVHTKSYV